MVDEMIETGGYASPRKPLCQRRGLEPVSFFPLAVFRNSPGPVWQCEPVGTYYQCAHWLKISSFHSRNQWNFRIGWSPEPCLHVGPALALARISPWREQRKVGGVGEDEAIHHRRPTLVPTNQRTAIPGACVRHFAVSLLTSRKIHTYSYWLVVAPPLILHLHGLVVEALTDLL